MDGTVTKTSAMIIAAFVKTAMNVITSIATKRMNCRETKSYLTRRFYES